MFKFFVVSQAKAYGHQVKVFIMASVFGTNFACHCEGATRSGLMIRKKIFFNILIETTATKESYFLSQHRTFGLT
jgi:hypothetical protein